MTVRGLVLSTHTKESFPGSQEDYGHIGYKGRGSIHSLSVPYLKGARAILLRLPRQPGSAGLGCALQPAIKGKLSNDQAPLIWRTQEKLGLIAGSFLPEAVHGAQDLALCVEPGMHRIVGSF